MEDKKKVITWAKNYLRGEDINDSRFDNLYQHLIQYEQYGYATEILLKKIEDKEDQVQK